MSVDESLHPTDGDYCFDPYSNGSWNAPWSHTGNWSPPWNPTPTRAPTHWSPPWSQPTSWTPPWNPTPTSWSPAWAPAPTRWYTSWSAPTWLGPPTLYGYSAAGCLGRGCLECEGDCDSDADCVGDLVCFQRTAFEFVRGCGGGGTGGENVFRVCSVPSILSSVVCWVPFEFDCSSEIFIAISHPFSSCGFSFSVPTPALSGWDYCAKELPPCDSFPEETSCTDGDARCASWASGGECQRNPSYMNTSCAKSCSICTPTERPPCRTAAPTMAPTLPLCDTTIPPWERPPCVDPLPPCQTNMELWEQAPCTPHWSEPLRPGEKPVLPSN